MPKHKTKYSKLINKQKYSSIHSTLYNIILMDTWVEILILCTYVIYLIF